MCICKLDSGVGTARAQRPGHQGGQWQHWPQYLSHKTGTVLSSAQALCASRGLKSYAHSGAVLCAQCSSSAQTQESSLQMPRTDLIHECEHVSVDVLANLCHQNSIITYHFKIWISGRNQNLKSSKHRLFLFAQAKFYNPWLSSQWFKFGKTMCI